MKSIRKTFFFDKYRKNISIEASVNMRPAISLEVDPSERSYTFHLSFIISLWLTFENVFPKSWFPEGYDSREISLEFHHYTFWWTFWMDPHSLNNKEPWYRRGNFGYLEAIKGKHTYSQQHVASRKMILPFEEGNYEIKITKIHRIDTWQRWPKQEMHLFDVEIAGGLPHEGKGENSWDQGEDATFSMSFPGSKQIQTLEQAAMYFWQRTMKTRWRYGGVNWTPAKSSASPILNLKKSA